MRLKAYASQAAKARHLSVVNARTTDSTPFSCKIHHEYNLDEARGYSASFDDATKEQIEQLGEVGSPTHTTWHLGSRVSNPDAADTYLSLHRSLL